MIACPLCSEILEKPLYLILHWRRLHRGIFLRPYDLWHNDHDAGWFKCPCCNIVVDGGTLTSHMETHTADDILAAGHAYLLGIETEKPK